MRKTMIIVFALIVVIGVAGLYLYASLDNIIRAAVEQIGSELTQTKVSLDDVELSPTSGEGALRGFRVTNPAGFSDDDAFRFSAVSIKVDITTIQSDPVVINELVIDGPRIIYEFGGGSSNLDTIKNNVQSQSGGSGSSESASASNSPKIVIENLYLRNGSVGVVAPVLDKKLEVPLPTVHLTDIGKEGNGATPAEVAQKILDSVLANAQKAVANANLDLGDLRKTADQLAGDAQKKIEDATKGMGGTVGSGAKDAGNAVEGLIKGLGK